ncbi:bis(5'-nucleosyl)-tetraphosphatase [Allorhodopirellula solitaria]|uniref:Bis(5'-nucleosyl)-tetraphosphatase [asymmetrical] n=1 Tax=Allorhodopirellula solitaria TaxID=2527987 RepID=A0A5C5YJ69_9BACT|nr:NUDIX domain-containing protein [Allorhodopirellula solitaria]TWT74918.1 dihydroneopterin triphosphate pyrophosphatase [Allorhodopirellula solitaria]
MSQVDLVRAAGVLVLTETSQPRFLLMRHPDRWDLPKGHCDGDETYLEAAQRELQEETGIDPLACRFDDQFRFDLRYQVSYRKHPKRVFDKNVRYFLAYVPDVVRIDVSEHDSFEWFAWSPPHHIQSQTIDPLLAAVAAHHSSC